jgi:hypothetical protein
MRDTRRRFLKREPPNTSRRPAAASPNDPGSGTTVVNICAHLNGIRPCRRIREAFEDDVYLLDSGIDAGTEVLVSRIDDCIGVFKAQFVDEYERKYMVHPGEEYCGMVLRAFGKVAEPRGPPLSNCWRSPAPKGQNMSAQRPSKLGTPATAGATRDCAMRDWLAPRSAAVAQPWVTDGEIRAKP